MDDKPTPKKKGRKPQLEPELVAAAIVELNGNLAAVAKRFNVHRISVLQFIGNRPTLQKVLEDAREGMLDHAESALYRAVLNGEAWAVCFFLKTQGRARGYVERAAELPPLEILLASLPPTMVVTVRAALAKAIHGSRHSRSA